MVKRPRNIGMGSLLHYRFPITAMASILHRLSGILLFLFVPLLIWALDLSLRSEQGFTSLKHCLQHSWVGVLLWLFGAALIYHLIAGVKHLLMDLGWCEGKTSGKVASWIVILIAIALIVWWGVALWY